MYKIHQRLAIKCPDLPLLNSFIPKDLVGNVVIINHLDITDLVLGLDLLHRHQVRSNLNLDIDLVAVGVVLTNVGLDVESKGEVIIILGKRFSGEVELAGGRLVNLSIVRLFVAIIVVTVNLKIL